MKDHFLSILLLFLFFPPHHAEKLSTISYGAKADVSYLDTKIKALYDEMDLAAAGLSEKAFSYAYKGYQYLVEKRRLDNTNILSICDFSQSSKRKRFYVLDLSSNKILVTTYVAHGRGSGSEYATRFSNKANSHQSSLGFYITGSAYYGSHGLSLKLQGLENGFNDRASRRHIVIHGASYAGDAHLQTNNFLGRSYGCPAVPQQECSTIIETIKNGTCLFLYFPAKKYLQNSRILND